MTWLPANAPMVFVGLCVLLRIAMAVGAETYPDEAYYWTWSQHPQLAYFDHPAMIAWSIGLLGIRFGAFLWALAALAGVHRLTLELGGSRGSAWWATALAVAMAAFSVAMLGMVFISGGGVRAPVLASTNAYVDGVRYGVAGALDRSQTSWPILARRAAAFPLAWSLGAATAVAGVNPLSRAGVTAAAGVIIVLVALLARRVTVADTTRRPTV